MTSVVFPGYEHLNRGFQCYLLNLGSLDTYWDISALRITPNLLDSYLFVHADGLLSSPAFAAQKAVGVFEKRFNLAMSYAQLLPTNKFQCIEESAHDCIESVAMSRMMEVKCNRLSI